MIEVIKWECLEEMDKLIEQWIKVDAIITDPPYWTTACKWDTVILFEPMWERLNKLIKPNGAIVLFGSEPFSSALRMSNINRYKYDWIWNKNTTTWFQHAKNMPLKNNENISVFSNWWMGHKILLWDKRMKYYPQWLIKINKINKTTKNKWWNITWKRPSHKDEFLTEYKNYPRTVLNYKWDKGFHPTQKPVDLIEYLIKTYTNKWELVLDFTAGSWTTGVACKNLDRECILIELDEDKDGNSLWYIDIINERLGK